MSRQKTKELLVYGGRKMDVTMSITVPNGVSVADAKDFLYDLEWVGGCRHPDEDPLFESISIDSATVKVKK